VQPLDPANNAATLFARQIINNSNMNTLNFRISLANLHKDNISAINNHWTNAKAPTIGLTQQHTTHFHWCCEDLLTDDFISDNANSSYPRSKRLGQDFVTSSKMNLPAAWMTSASLMDWP
jgi:hypothetical protein